MVAFENKDKSDIGIHVWTAKPCKQTLSNAMKCRFIHKRKKGVLSWLFKVYVSFNETDLFTIQKGTIKLSDSFNKVPAKLIL